MHPLAEKISVLCGAVQSLWRETTGAPPPAEVWDKLIVMGVFDEVFADVPDKRTPGGQPGVSRGPYSRGRADEDGPPASLGEFTRFVGDGMLYAGKRPVSDRVLCRAVAQVLGCPFETVRSAYNREKKRPQGMVHLSKTVQRTKRKPAMIRRWLTWVHEVWQTWPAEQQIAALPLVEAALRFVERSERAHLSRLQALTEGLRECRRRSLRRQARLRAAAYPGEDKLRAKADEECARTLTDAQWFPLLARAIRLRKEHSDWTDRALLRQAAGDCGLTSRRSRGTPG